MFIQCRTSFSSRRIRGRFMLFFSTTICINSSYSNQPHQVKKCFLPAATNPHQPHTNTPSATPSLHHTRPASSSPPPLYVHRWCFFCVCEDGLLLTSSPGDSSFASLRYKGSLVSVAASHSYITPSCRCSRFEQHSRRLSSAV